MNNLRSLLALPQVRTISEGERFWSHYQSVVDQTVVRGNLVPDAHIAAILLEHDVGVLYTRDRDFAKFAEIRVRDPFAEG